jgi:hypothetical protein
MATQLNLRPLTTNERAENSGFTHIAVFDHSDLTETTANTSQVFNLTKAQPGDVVVKYALRLQPAFKDSADAAFNSTAFSLGDEDLATRFFSAVQTNENGTEVIHSFTNTAFGPYTAEKQLTATFAAMAAKNLAALNTGRAVLLIEILQLDVLGQGAA